MASTPVSIEGVTTLVGYNVTLPFVTTDSYTFSFPYLSREHFEIEVATETILDSADYQFVSDYLIQLTSIGVDKLNALYSDLTATTLVIRRKTTSSGRLVDFRDAAILTEADLDLDANQTFYILQELLDSYKVGLFGYNPVDGNIDGEGAQLINIADPTVLSGAVNLNTLFNNVVTPDYTAGDTYRAGRLIFYAGNLYRANTDIASAPSIPNAADFDLIFTDEMIAQITINQNNIGLLQADVAQNTLDIADVANDLSNHESENETAHTHRDLRAALDTWALTASNGAIAFATDLKLYYFAAEGVLTPLGTSNGLNYIGTWDASTNTPSLPTGIEENGDYYKVSVAGTTNIDGISDWSVNDWIIYNGTSYQQIDNSELVTSVNGKTGDVELELDDYTIVAIQTFDVDAPSDVYSISGNLTVSSEATNPLQGARSAKITQSGASANDSVYFAPAYEVTLTPEMKASKLQAIRVLLSYNENDGDMTYVREFYNGTDWTTISPESFEIKSGTNPYIEQYYLNQSATKYRDKVIVNTPSNSAELLIDKIGLDLNPFVGIIGKGGEIGEIQFQPHVMQGFIPVDNKTIGKTTANYAGIDYRELYNYLWAKKKALNDAAQSTSQIVITLGASAQADWDADKAITVDFRDMFLRATDGTRLPFAYQEDAFQYHTHTLTGGNAAGSGGYFLNQATSSNFLANNSMTSTVTGRADNETRPKNIALIPQMRYASTDLIIQLPLGGDEVDQTETKYLASDVTTDGVMSGLTFSNLEIGTHYRIGGLMYANCANGDSIAIDIKNGTNTVQMVRAAPQATLGGTSAISVEFQATSTSLTFTAASISAGSIIRGDGTGVGTFVQLTKIAKPTAKAFATSSDLQYCYPVETRIGWYGIKPLYAKTYEITSTLAAGTTTVLDTIVGASPVNAISYAADYAYFRIDYFDGPIWYRYQYSTGYVAVVVGANSQPVLSGNFTIKYTKP